MLEGTTYTAADVLNAAADLIDKEGFVNIASDPEATFDAVGPGVGYDIPRSFDEVVYGDLHWSSTFEYAFGLKQPSDQYDSARDAFRHAVIDQYGNVEDSEESWNEWDATLTTESVVALLRSSINYIHQDVAA